MAASKCHGGYFRGNKQYNPTILEDKPEYQKVLLDVGFKENEVCFVSGCGTEHEFLWNLIDETGSPGI